MKRPFHLHTVLAHIEKAIAPFAKAAMFELYDRGYASLFEQLMGCIISIRTFDETTIPVSETLFAQARTPEQVLKLSPAKLEALLDGSSFPGQKAATILGIARAAQEQYKGELPADFHVLTQLKGVGPKCAKLVLGVAGKQPGISVDVHVHRVTNRWGIVHTSTPENTLAALEALVPEKSWIDINRLLVPFGKHICTGRLPHCSTCPVLEYCRQVGVSSHR